MGLCPGMEKPRVDLFRVSSSSRGDISKAKAELAKVQKQAMTLLPLVQQHETLRSGSYSSALEEYAEAMLFMVFLEEGRYAL